MHLEMPIGVDDFQELRSSYYFVDKTCLISSFTGQQAKVTLFTRPRRFGKTLTLSMLYYFFHVEDAAVHRDLFAGLDVSHDAAAMVQQGTRPVLFLSLKKWCAASWKEMRETIQFNLSELYDAQRYLLRSPNLSERAQKLFRTIQLGEADMVACRSGLSFLMQVMETYYGKKVILLLDEYDVPVQSAWEHDYYDEAISFFREFYADALKTNASLDFAVLTGVLRIAKESIFSALNNLQVDSLVTTRFPTAFGYTRAEVAKMATTLGHADKLPELRAWYDGYALRGHELYNPWSVNNYFSHHCEAQAYWVNTSGNAILGALMSRTDAEHIEALKGLLDGGTVSGYMREGVIYSDIGDDEDALYTMLYTTGYLTVAGEERGDLETRYELRLPNKEMLYLFTIEVIKRYQKGLSKSYLENLMQAFLHGQAERVQQGLARYLQVVVSSFDVGSRESFYHGFVLGMTALLVPSYEVRSNRESGSGRYDIAVFPKDNQRSGVLMEFKTAKNEQELESRAKEALTQINARAYTIEFADRGIQTLHCYGIAFYGKQVKVVLG